MYNELRNINTKEDMIKFLQILANDNRVNNGEWINNTIENYIESIQSWIEDMDEYYKNNNIEKPKNIDWNFIATLFYVGKIYE